MQTALTQQHLYIGLVGLSVQIVDKKHGEIYLVSHHHCRYLGIATHWS